MLTIDFESRSAADLKKAGTWAYTAHPTTDANCLGFMFDDDPDLGFWHPAFPNAYRKEKAKKVSAPLAEYRHRVEELHDRIASGELVEAHNALFEHGMWKHVMVRKYGWPEIKPEQWRCSAAKAAYYGLPRKLEQAVNALQLAVRKDMTGNRLAVKMSKPRTPTKTELKLAGCETPEEFFARFGYLWHENVEDFAVLFAYNKTDVLAEHGLSSNLRPIPDIELRTWQLDQEINIRGVQCDTALAQRALAFVDRYAHEADGAVALATGFEVTGCTKREDLVTWVREQKVPLPDTQAETLDLFLETQQMPDVVRNVLAIWRMASKTSVKKYRALLERVMADGRMRDNLMYWAAHTGRWGGRGFQPQNLPRGYSTGEYGKPGKGEPSMEEVCAAIIEQTFEMLELLYGDVMEVLSKAVRGCIIAPDGRVINVADYSAVEARGTFWIADHEKGLQLFREIDAGQRPGEDIYTCQASEILGRKVTKKDKDDRQVWGKVPVLGCGYQMGAPKLVAYAASMGVTIDLETSQRIVKGYRDSNQPVVQFWKNIEATAIEAVRRGRDGVPVTCGKTQWAVRGRFLHCKLPSGRMLSYCDPRVEMEMTPWEEYQPKLRYWGVDSYTHQWARLSTYGGKLTENIVQAICRDIMRDAMLNVDKHPDYDLVLTVHDEVVAESDDDKGSIKEFEALVGHQPEWAAGFPVVAEGWRGKRYRK